MGSRTKARWSTSYSMELNLIGISLKASDWGDLKYHAQQCAALTAMERSGITAREFFRYAHTPISTR